jgi:serine phosphatase RsbU (regulator of sigma subunit)
MKVHWTRSISIKLFFLIGLCLLITAAGISWRNSVMFGDLLGRQLEDQTILQAKDATNNIDSIVENWISLTTFSIQNVQSQSADQTAAVAKRLLESSSEFVALEVLRKNGADFQSVAFEARTFEDLRFEDREPAKVISKLRAFKDRFFTRTGTEYPRVVDLSNDLKLPLMVVPIRFKGKGEDDVWVFLTAWQTRLLKALPNSETVTSYLLDKQGQPLFYSTPKKEIEKYKPIHQMALAGQSFGYKQFRIPVEKNRPMTYMSAFYKGEVLGASTIIVRDGTNAYSVVEKIIIRTALWTWVFFLGSLMISYLAAKGITKRLKAVTTSTLRVAMGDFSNKVEPKGKDEVSLLSHAVNHMSSQIQWLLRSQVEKARQDKELEMAKMVQSTFFPRKELKSSMLSFSGQTVSASECGGDWWGYFNLKSGKELFVIADVTGHGTAAALVTAMAYSGYQMIQKLVQLDSQIELSPKMILKNMNDLLFEAGKGKTSMTSLVAIVDPSTGIMDYVSAGHNTPYIIPKNLHSPLAGTTSAKKPKFHQPMPGKGTPLGILGDWDADEKTALLQPGDKIVFYTDGIFECANSGGEVWGSKRFRSAIDQWSTLSGEALKQKLFEQAYAHFGKNAPNDDITLVVAEVSGSWTPTMRKAQ